MSIDLSIHKQHHIHQGNCCHHKEQSNFDLLTSAIEKTSAVALGALSLYTNWTLFIPSFFAGMCIGIYNHTTGQDSSSTHHSASSCAHGLLEQLTGVQLPRTVSLIANIAATACHIDHHDTVFVPIAGVSLGNWAGKAAAVYGSLAYKEIMAYLSEKPGVPSLAFA